ncbi:MAG: serine/threonine protein kinase [Anaerolineales bacterium]|nr:serine/threonine protein kinase [Anaerolineales bacterium]
MVDLTGTTLDKYEIIERKGRGGMATVYKAYHPRLNRYVAIKVLHSHLAEASDFLSRFEREAKAVAALRHPHIVQAYDFDIQGDIYYLVMEFIDGPNLQDRLNDLTRQGKLMPLEEVGRILHQVADALDYAHQQGMLHRDMKPSNVLLDHNGQAYLVDFGIARMLSGTQFTATGELLGTPAYMSPEQGMGQPLAPATDLYSLGIMLYEMLVGQVPFDADTPFGIIHKHINEPPPALRGLRPDLPAGLEQMLTRALAKKPEHRYRSALEMAQAFEQALGMAVREAAAPRPPIAQAPVGDPFATKKQPQPAVPPAAPPASIPQPKPLPAAAAPKPPSPTPAAPPAKRKKRSPLLGIFVALLVLGAGIAAAVIFGPQLMSRPECGSTPECFDLGMAAREGGDLETALYYFDMALEKVSPEQHPASAHIWCERGITNRDMGSRDIAINDFHMCMEWTQGDPELEHLRRLASEQLQQLGAP